MAPVTISIAGDKGRPMSTAVNAGPAWASTVSNTSTRMKDVRGTRLDKAEREALADALTRVATGGGSVTVGIITVTRAV